MGILCCSNPGEGRGANSKKNGDNSGGDMGEKGGDARRRASIKPSHAHRDRKLVKDYILGAQLGQGAYGEVRECAHK